MAAHVRASCWFCGKPLRAPFLYACAPCWAASPVDQHRLIADGAPSPHDRAGQTPETPTLKLEAPRRECGAEKCGSKIHSAWCPRDAP